MVSEINTLTNKLVDRRQRELIDLVSNWSFISAGPTFKSEKYDGSLIRYQGIKFQGSPRKVFWSGYIEPYLENYGLGIIEEVGKTSYECDSETEVAIIECLVALNNMVSNVYNKMAEVDSRLMGNGFKQGEKRDVSNLVSLMQNTLNGHAVIIQKKYLKMKTDKNNSYTTNTFNAPVGNVQTGNSSVQNITNSSGRKTTFQWVMDHLISVIVASVIAGISVVYLSDWLNIGGK